MHAKRTNTSHVTAYVTKGIKGGARQHAFSSPHSHGVSPRQPPSEAAATGCSSEQREAPHYTIRVAQKLIRLTQSYSKVRTQWPRRVRHKGKPCVMQRAATQHGDSSVGGSRPHSSHGYRSIALSQFLLVTLGVSGLDPKGLRAELLTSADD